jgi:hypothetical protein
MLSPFCCAHFICSFAIHNIGRQREGPADFDVPTVTTGVAAGGMIFEPQTHGCGEKHAMVVIAQSQLLSVMPQAAATSRACW